MFHYYYILLFIIVIEVIESLKKYITVLKQNKQHNYLKIVIIREYINLLLLCYIYNIYILKCTYIFNHILFIILTI